SRINHADYIGTIKYEKPTLFCHSRLRAGIQTFFNLLDTSRSLPRTLIRGWYDIFLGGGGSAIFVAMTR
ncbi:MAG: hypothetical protein Q8O43_07765, partial [Dehalococcoidia bacterium]|nr:hypothetical protein [Dehalococcoidia bacterium]